MTGVQTCALPISWYWAQAKTHETTQLQKGGWLDKGIKQFTDKQYRPGLGAFKKD